jgi:alpha-L-fucosidase
MHGPTSAMALIDLDREERIGLVDLREDIWQGQRVARYAVEGNVNGAWQTLSRGTTIGYRKLDRFPPVRVRSLRIAIEDAIEEPLSLSVGLYRGS